VSKADPIDDVALSDDGSLDATGTEASDIGSSDTDDVTPVDQAVVVAEPSARRSPAALEALRWIGYLAVSAVVLRPVLITAITADDFQNPFSLWFRTGPSFREVVRSGWDGAGAVGHFNYIGQIFGNAATWAQMIAMSEFGIRYSEMYAAIKFVAFVLCALAGAAYVRRGSAMVGSPIGAWTSRILVSALLFFTLQLHMPWSNDPTGSYPLSGFVPAAIGFAMLVAMLRAVASSGRGAPWLVAVVGVVAVLYYEINAAAVAAAAVIGLGAVLDARKDGRAVATAVRLAPAVVVPTLVTTYLQLRASSSSVNYEGTSIDRSGTVSTFARGLVSSLPGAAWGQSREWLTVPVALRSGALLSLFVGGLALALLARHRPSEAPPRPRRSWFLAGFVLAPACYWFGATLIQSATAKVQNEATRVGKVYNFYAMGSVAVAVLLAIAIHLVPWNRVTRSLAAPAIVVASLFAFVQVSVNWNVMERFNGFTRPNQRLLLAYSEQWDEPERCAALTEWAAGIWPEYYEVGMIVGLDAGYQHFHGEPFCEGFVRPP
jgi:hypothetical protein